MRARQVEVSTSGRGRASQPRHVVLQLPLTSSADAHLDLELASGGDADIVESAIVESAITESAITESAIVESVITESAIVELAG